MGTGAISTVMYGCGSVVFGIVIADVTSFEVGGGGGDVAGEDGRAFIRYLGSKTYMQSHMFCMYMYEVQLCS